MSHVLPLSLDIKMSVLLGTPVPKTSLEATIWPVGSLTKLGVPRYIPDDFELCTTTVPGTPLNCSFLPDFSSEPSFLQPANVIAGNVRINKEKKNILLFIIIKKG